MHDLIHGRWRAEVARTVLRLGIPDLLGTGTAEVTELAAAAGARPDRLRRLLVLATRIGLFEQVDAVCFRNNAASDLLRADHPRSMCGEACHALSEWQRIAWDNLDHAVRHGSSGFEFATGTGVFAYLDDHPDEAADFHAFQATVTRRNAAALLAGHEFPAGATVVDVGGGAGALLTAVLYRDHSLKGILFDRADAVRQARQALADSPVADRLTIVDGDFFTAVPGGGDVYVLSHILHDWPAEEAVRILGRIAAALTPQAYLLVVENVRDEQSNLLVDYLDVLMLTAWGSRERTVDEYAELFTAAGLRLDARTVLEPRSRLTALTVRRAD